MKKLEPMSAEARDLLDDVRDAHDPSDADRARVRRALMATVAGSAGLAASTAASSAAASTAATGAAVGGGLSLGLKIAAVVTIVGAVGGTVAVAPWEPSEPEQHDAARSPSPEAAVAPQTHPAIAEGHETSTHPAARDTTSDPAPTDPGLVHDLAEATGDLDAPAARRPALGRTVGEGRRDDGVRSDRGGARVRPAAPAATDDGTHVESDPAAAVTHDRDAPSDGTSAPAPGAPSSLAEEIALLRRAQRAINRGDPDAALGVLGQHATRFPDGVMAEEREAARVVALCDAGRRDEAAAVAARFLRERPGSPLAARVRAACD